MKLTLVWIGLFSFINTVLGARILAMIPFPGKSHHIFNSAVLRVLTDRGHEVVEYSPFPPKQSIPNHTHVKLHTSFGDVLGKLTYESLMDLQQLNYFGIASLVIWNSVYSVCDETLNDEKIKKLLQSNEHFDLVITSSTFGQESMLLFGHRFGAPTITLQGFHYSCILNRESGNSLSFASVPDTMSFSFTNQMTFKERLKNFISGTLTMILFYTSHLPKQEAIMRKYYNHPNTPPLADMVTNISLALVNTHPAVAYPQPYSPNIIPIGGITISPDRTELPKDIQKFMDEATDGVIYFSFGTVVHTHTIPLELLKIFINVFEKLHNKVLWKIDKDTLPGLPKNVKLVKWTPQIGVLNHPNCAVFITHGGLFSQQEALYAGVPVVGIPFFGDQRSNVRFSEHLGIGARLDLKTLSESNLYDALTTVLSNSSYKNNAKQLSNIYRDRTMSPAESTIYWIEYVLRHKGAAHLRPASAHLAWYQLYLLDVLAVFVACTLILLCLICYVLRKGVFFLSRRIKGSSFSKDKKKN